MAGPCCEQHITIDGMKHEPRCENAMTTMRKADFVDSAEGGASAAIDTYLFLINDEGLTHDDAKETAVAESRESATCFVGIGSCGGGGCKHG